MYVMSNSHLTVVAKTDPLLTVMSIRTALRSSQAPSDSLTTSIYVAELMEDGSMTYIDTLCSEGILFPISRTVDPTRVAITPVTVPMATRKVYDRFPTADELSDEGLRNDGVIVLGKSEAYRVKPIRSVDLDVQPGNGGYYHVVRPDVWRWRKQNGRGNLLRGQCQWRGHCPNGIGGSVSEFAMAENGRGGVTHTFMKARDKVYPNSVEVYECAKACVLGLPSSSLISREFVIVSFAARRETYRRQDSVFLLM